MSLSQISAALAASLPGAVVWTDDVLPVVWAAAGDGACGARLRADGSFEIVTDALGMAMGRSAMPWSPARTVGQAADRVEAALVNEMRAERHLRKGPGAWEGRPDAPGAAARLLHEAGMVSQRVRGAALGIRAQDIIWEILGQIPGSSATRGADDASAIKVRAGGRVALVRLQEGGGGECGEHAFGTDSAAVDLIAAALGVETRRGA